MTKVQFLGGALLALCAAFDASAGFWRAETDLCVTDFGAKGDGVADDTAALQRAADALVEKNGTGVEPRYRKKWYGKSDREQVRLVFPKGKYRITSPVFFRCKACVAGDGAEIIQENPSADAFYLGHGFMCRFSGFVFRGGKSQIRLCTHNTEGSNLYVGDCAFYGSSGSAIECRTYQTVVADGKKGYDRSKEIGEWMWNAETKRFERDPRWDGPREPSYNSTFLMIERCEFDDCGRAADFTCDGAVLRKCRIRSRRSTSGGAILCPNLVHAYKLDILIRRDPKIRQCVFECTNCRANIWIEDAKVRTDNGLGVPLVWCSRSRVPSYMASSIIVENVETETEKGSGIVEVLEGRPVNIISLLRVRETDKRKSVPMISMRGDVTEEQLAKIAPSDRYPVGLSYSFCMGECKGIVPPAGLLARYMRETPDARSGKDLFPLVKAPRRKGPVLYAKDDGVDTDPASDDTESMGRFLRRLAGEPDAIGVLPGARLTVGSALTVKGDFDLVGAGMTLIDAAKEDEDVFHVAPGSRISFKNLILGGGRTVIDVAAGSDVRLEGSFIYDPAGTAVRVAKDGTFLMDDGMAYASDLYEGDGRGFFNSVWYRFIRSRIEGRVPGPALVNRGQLQMWDVLGVPVLLSKYAMNDVFHPELPPLEYRWVDNSGEFLSRMSRFGGEWGGITPVFHHGKSAVSAIEGSYAWFTTTFTYPTPVLSDVPTPDARCFAVTFAPLFKYLPDIEFLYRDRVGARPCHAKAGRIDACYPMPLDTKTK